MRDMVFLDLSSGLAKGMEVVSPENFREHENPIPLSIVQRLDDYRRTHPREDRETYCHYWQKMGLDNNLVIRFSGNVLWGIYGDFPLLPDEIRAQMNQETKVGDVFTLRGKNLVLLEIQPGSICKLMCFAPGEWFDATA